MKPRLVIDIVSDPVCPWCYVGVRSFLMSREALTEFDIAARFRPYQLNPDLPPEGVDRRAYYSAKFPDPDALAATRARIKEAARQTGFDFDAAAPERLPNTLKAHQLIRFAAENGRQEDVVLGVYGAFWDELLDIGDDAVLRDVAVAARLDRDAAAEALASGKQAEATAAEADAFRRGGVSGVPTFIVNERTGFSGGMPPAELTALLRRAAEMTGAQS